MESIPPIPSPPTCSESEKRILRALARQAIQEAIQGRPTTEPEPALLTDTLTRPAATFVTLSLEHRLRGCVGNLVAHEPLHRSVATNAVGAALRDTRFVPVTLEELAGVGIHVSVLSPLIPVEPHSPGELLEQITPGLDGVVLRWPNRTATYLPQVWKTIRDREEFLNALSRKAGMGPSAWQAGEAEVLLYRVSEFGDDEAP